MIKQFCAASVIALCGTAASAATINFDTNGGVALNNGDQLTTFDFGGGVRGFLTVTNNAIPESGSDEVAEARIFDTLTGFTIDVPPPQETQDSDLIGPFTNVANTADQRDFDNALIIQENVDDRGGIPDDEADGGSITFTFENAIDLISIIFLDGEEGFQVNSGGSSLGSLGPGNSGDRQFAEVMFGANATNISEFTVNFGGSGAIGSFDANLSAVPVPAALPMLLLGLGGLGALRRRRKAA